MFRTLSIGGFESTQIEVGGVLMFLWWPVRSVIPFLTNFNIDKGGTPLFTLLLQANLIVDL